MNDDPFLDLFALDLPDLTECSPDLSLALALALPDPRDPLHPLHPAFPLGPTGGGWPRFWDNIDDIIGAGWDVIKTIGETAKDIIESVWSGVGGAIRWLYNWATGIVDWLGRQLFSYFDWAGRFINTSADWLRNRVWDAAYYVRDRVWDGAYWLRDRISDFSGSITRGVQAGLEWAGGQVWGAANWVKDRVWDSAAWVRDRLVEYTTGLWHNIWDAANWTFNAILPPIMGAAQSVADVFREAFDLIAGAIRDAIGALAGQILAALKFAVETTTNALDALADKLSDAIRWPWEHIFEPFTDVVERKLAIPGKLLDGQYRDLRDLIDDVVDPAPVIIAGIAGAIILSIVISMITAGIMQILVQPLCEPHVQATQARVGAQLLTVGVVQDALNRGFIDEPTADDHLSRMGYSGSAKQALLDLRYYIPPPTDLIRMAVREVFNPELRQALDLDAEFPEPFAQYAALAGIKREWAENEWAMHWDLPSPSQGYEMLHRGLIEEAELAALLKALDYAPVWRDKLRDIAYSPITRVDLRRLYKGGVITEQDVFAGYKALGYDDERARWLTDWTMKYYTPEDESELDEYTKETAAQIRLAYRRHVILRAEALDKLVELGYSEDGADFLLAIDDAQLALNPTTDAGIPVRDLSQAVIRKAYREKIWDPARAQEELEVLGYLPWEADLLLQLEDLDEERELAELEESVVKEEYTRRAIDRGQASGRLDAINVSVDRRDLLLRRWDLQAAQKTRTLTVAQLQAALRDARLSETDVLSRLSGMGFNDVDAKLLVDAVDTTVEGIQRRLSASQLSRAYKVNAITDAQFLAALVDLGYSQDDAQVLVDIATPAPEAKVRQLTAGQLAAGFRADLLTESDFLQRLTVAGYAQADAELLRDLAARQPEPAARKLSVANIKALYAAETLDRAGVLAELLALGYTERDAGWLRNIIAPEE